jgi:SAM-dependent methyltransferase
MLAAMHPDARRWNRRYRDQGGSPGMRVEPVLEAHAALLGPPGRGLEIACGTAANALWLATRGHHMVALDVSVEALRIAGAQARRLGLLPARAARRPARRGHADAGGGETGEPVQAPACPSTRRAGAAAAARQAGAAPCPPPWAGGGRGLCLVVGDAGCLPFRHGPAFDLIVVVRYLERALFPWIASALAPGGRLFYLTFNRGRLASRPGFNPDYLLADGELQAAFPGLQRLAGEEGEESSWLIARRPG